MHSSRIGRLYKNTPREVINVLFKAGFFRFLAHHYYIVYHQWTVLFLSTFPIFEYNVAQFSSASGSHTQLVSARKLIMVSSKNECAHHVLESWRIQYMWSQVIRCDKFQNSLISYNIGYFIERKSHASSLILTFHRIYWLNADFCFSSIFNFLSWVTISVHDRARSIVRFWKARRSALPYSQGSRKWRSLRVPIDDVVYGQLLHSKMIDHQKPFMCFTRLFI